jgi:hypothetical protein
MDATLYTGTGSTQTIVNQGQFKPDFVWGKSRSLAQQHLLFDSVRGTGKYLQSQSTAAEGTDATTLSSFNSNGFTLGSNITINTNASTNVAWQWQAGQGSSSSNTSGTITSTVSVNATAGFSVVTYTGTGVNATVGHGLGVAPKWVVVKRRNGGGTENWMVYHAAITTPNANPGNNRMLLNLVNASNTDSTIWNNTNPTSSVFSIGTSSEVNANTGTYVAYCWAEIAGFSKFGSFTGNGSVDGPFVYTGFRPSFFMIKRTDVSSDWFMLDDQRPTFNIIGAGNGGQLAANQSYAESTLSLYDIADFLSNGIKVRCDMTYGYWNASGGTYIYMAFAEHPFKNANAR